MAFQTPKGEQTTLNEINIIPLVDVMLVLLVIFMITAPFLQESIDVDLPAVSTAEANTEKKDKVVTINQEGQVFIQGDDKNTYNLETLAAPLKELFEGESETDKILFIRADKNVPYGTVVQIMSLAKELGIVRIGMITQPDETKRGS